MKTVHIDEYEKHRKQLHQIKYKKWYDFMWVSDIVIGIAVLIFVIVKLTQLCSLNGFLPSESLWLMVLMGGLICLILSTLGFSIYKLVKNQEYKKG